MRILPLAVGLLLACLTIPSHAVEVCWDYPAWRVMVYENGPAYTVPDVNNMTSLPVIRVWLANSARYECVLPPWQVNDYSPPPIALKYGDVILLKPPGTMSGVEGHGGFVNAQGTIDHYLQLYNLNNRTIRERSDPRGFIPQRCPDQSTPLSQVNTCPGWRIDPNTGQAKPICCGLFQGDPWQGWLDRQSFWKGGSLEIWREKDTDKDRVPDWKDKCENTPADDRLLVDAYGCAPSQLDDDLDGVKNDKDLCANTPPNERKQVDPKGCGPSQRDTDGDGVMDDKDDCKDTPRGEAVDEHGCSLRQRIRLTIDADDPVNVGGVARFTAKIDHNSEVDLAHFTHGYDWLVDGQQKGQTGETFTGTVAENYSKETLTATVELWVITTQGQRIPLVKESKTVHVRKPSGKVLMFRSGAWTPEVGKQAAYQARVEDPGATAQTLYAYYWFLNDLNMMTGYNQTTFSFAVRSGKNTVTVRVIKTSDRGARANWQKVGVDVTDSFDAQGQPVGSDIRPFVGTWKQPYHGGVSTLTIKADGSGKSEALGTERTTTKVSRETPNKEDGTLSGCVVVGQALKCSWESTYSDGDKTITRGGTLTCTLNGDTLTTTAEVDKDPAGRRIVPTTIKEKWNIPKAQQDYTPGARSGGTSTFTRAR